jgi:hypothetical protein
MGLYNFQERFEDGIRSGQIRHTIRGLRFYGRQRAPGRQDGPGDVMHLYAGMRTKACRLLGRFVCTAVEQIRIAVKWKSWTSTRIWINGEILSVDESEEFARRDGFASFAVFQRYWKTHRGGDLPFDGFVFHWDFEHPVAVRAVSAPKKNSARRQKGVRSAAEARFSGASGSRSRQVPGVLVQRKRTACEQPCEQGVRPDRHA